MITLPFYYTLNTVGESSYVFIRTIINKKAFYSPD